MQKSYENVIEWLTGSDKVSLTLNQQKYISKVQKLAKDNPGEVKIWDNKDGSIFATLPLKWINISKRKGREFSEEEKEAAAERLRNMWKEKKKNEESIKK